MTKSVVKKVTTETVDDEGNRKTIVKEHAPKETVVKKKVVRAKKMTAKEREELLIENFVGLQHAMTNMSVKFGALSDNISKLLQIFEESAKNFMSGGKPDDKEMLDKIDSLLNQNKTIAKGLVLMEGKLRGRSEEPQVMMPRPQTPPIRPKPLPSI
ncbi:hypothetical protein HN903_02900 [archaeon]|jgi:hypothetical protein|nr:hypothetical protein [archaeon]MBT7128680.1 hypothetical protein [archaeon]